MVNLVIFGDNFVGKTVWISKVKDILTAHRINPVFINYAYEFDDFIHDSVYLVMFSLTDEESYKNVQSYLQFIYERVMWQDFKILVCGTKADLDQDYPKDPKLSYVRISIYQNFEEPIMRLFNIPLITQDRRK